MVSVDKETIDVALGKKAERMVNAGIASASFLRRRDPKQVKILEDAGGKITVAVYLGFPFYMEMTHGKMLSRTQQSIWMWDGAGIIRKEPMASYKVMETFDDENYVLDVYDSFVVPSDVFKFMRSNGSRMPENVRLADSTRREREIL